MQSMFLKFIGRVSGKIILIKTESILIIVPRDGYYEVKYQDGKNDSRTAEVKISNEELDAIAGITKKKTLRLKQ